MYNWCFPTSINGTTFFNNMPIVGTDPSNANNTLGNVNLIYTFKEQTLPNQTFLMKTKNAPCALRGQPNGLQLSCDNVNFQNALNEPSSM